MTICRKLGKLKSEINILENNIINLGFIGGKNED